MIEQKIIAAAKANWLAWQGLRILQPELAAWMEGHRAECRYVCSDMRLNPAIPHSFSNGSVYRLRPDYEPLKWWFSKIQLCVSEQPADNTLMDDGEWLEVTPEYADYLRTKPDGKWELRMVKVGDEYWCMHDEKPEKCYIGMVDEGPTDRGYRWCTPKVDIAAMEIAVMKADEELQAALRKYDAAVKALRKEQQ